MSDVYEYGLWPKFMGRQKKKGLIAQLAEASDGQPKTCH